jgi:hypothetical protein
MSLDERNEGDSEPKTIDEGRRSPLRRSRELKDMDSKYHILWDDKMQSFGLMTLLYLKVHVLMISWDKSCDDLKTNQEVCRHHSIDEVFTHQEQVIDLADVFTNRYNFDVSFLKLKNEPTKKTQNTLNFELSKFVKEKDDKNTLLIVYYAGHGMVDESGQIELAGWKGPTAIDKVEMNRVVWNSAGKCHVLQTRRVTVF